MIIKLIVGALILGYICYKNDMIGYYDSLPYQSTVYVEPSNITTKCNYDTNMGFCLGKYYLAFYVNRNLMNNENKYSTRIYYFATPDTILRLTREAYYNDRSKY